MEEYSNLSIPSAVNEQKMLLRSLMNVRMPRAIGEDFLKIQDEYLKNELNNKGITDADSLAPASGRLYIWQGDITTLKCDVVVNAANSQMLGCFIPCHRCIDNAIHSFSGIQLRLECDALMSKKGRPIGIGEAEITNAYNLPCKYVIHTVGPIISGRITDRDCRLLSDCYISCLSKADEKGLKSIAFCCISTGEFHFPNEKAAETAVKTVRNYIKNSNIEKVIFNVFKDEDKEIYKRIL